METSDALKLGKGGLDIIYRKTGMEPEVIEEVKPEIIQEVAKIESIEFILKLDRIESKLELVESIVELVALRQTNILKAIETKQKGIRTLFRRIIEWFRN